jgi:uncharacterized protein (UPF0261 family)
MTHAYVVGTGDTKFDELSYVKNLLQQAGVSVKLVDIGPLSQQTDVDVTAGKVASFHPEGADAVFRETDRGRALAAMTTAFEHFVEAHRDDIAGMIGLGGSGNTALELKKPTGITVQDTHGMVSCCEWTGVRLSTLLQEAGMHKDATWLLAEGADASSMTRSIPMAKALDDAMLLFGVAL